MKHYKSLTLVIITLLTITSSVFAQKNTRVDIVSADPIFEDTQKPGVQVKKVKEVQAPTSELVTATTYAFTTSAAVALEDMSSGTTTLVGANLDDNASSLVNIGFDFWYDGVRFSQFSCNANGICRLGGTVISTSFNNSTDFNSTTNAPKIAPYFDDLWTGTNGKVHFKVVGAVGSRKLIVEWQNEQIPRVGSGNAGAGTFQMWLFESSHTSTPGVIQFVYGSGVGANAANAGYSIGLQSGAATNFASVTTSTNTVSYAAANNTQTNAIASGTSYLFTPNIPNAPSNNLVSGITPTSLTLNWLDNSSNEVGFVVYRSTDNVNFTFVTQTAANAVSFTDTGLTPSTNYFYNVHAVTEGALSTLTSFGANTAAPGAISCAGAGGNWNTAGTWSGGIPTAGDNVTIGSGCTVTIDTTAVAFSVTVQSGGVLQYDAGAVVRTLTIGGNVTIDSGGTFQTNPGGGITTHVLSLTGNITNNGTLDFSTNGNTAGAGITFTGAANATLGGTGTTTDIRAITIAKATLAQVVELNPTNFTVQGVNTDVAGFLTLTSGTFKISGTFTMTNRVFPTVTYVIPALGGIWLNNPNFTVAAQVSGSSTAVTGLMRVSLGTYNIGVGLGDQMRGNTGAVFTFEGGTTNVSGAFDPQSDVTYNQSGGTLNVGIVGNNVSNFGTFELFGTNTVFNMSGGTINIVNPCTGTTKVDYRNNAPLANTNITGGTVVIGATGATPASIYNMVATTGTVVPGITVNATQTMRLVNIALFMRGSTVINNGIIDLTGANARFDFGSIGAGPMSYSGTGIFGTLVTPFAGVGISANSLFFTTLNAPIVVNRVNLFQGGFINSNQITLGNAGASTTVVQTGSAGLLTPGGSFDVSPVHNAGTGGHVVLYAQESVMRMTGFEINPSRTLNTLIVSTTNNVTISGGDITVTAALTLTDGVVFTGANTLIFNGPSASETRTNGYVDGNLGRTYSAIGSFTYFVGQNGFTPVLANVTAAAPLAPTSPSLTVRSFDATLAGFSPGQSISRNWQLEANGTITADLTFTYLLADVNGNESDYRVYRRNSNGTTTNLCAGGPCVNTIAHSVNVTGVSTFSRWTAAELITPTAASANIGGRVLTSNGMPIANVKVVLSGGGLEHSIVGTTGTLGYYNFADLPVGQDYIVTVKSRRFTFANPTHVINLQDNILDSDFMADPVTSRGN